MVVLSGLADGMGCDPVNSISTCSLVVNYLPLLSGTYSLLVNDAGTNQAGSYNFTLACLFGTGPGFTCTDLPPSPVPCSDNCSVVDNVDQTDSNGDGFGNLCDGDLNNDGSTDTLDLNLYKLAHRSAVGDANYDIDADFNGDGVINTLDLNIYKGLHRLPPGPSCVAPNSP